MVCVLILFPLDPSSSVVRRNSIFCAFIFVQLVKRRRFEISESSHDIPYVIHILF